MDGSSDKHPRDDRVKRAGTGMGVGIALGVALGAALGNIGLGLGIGILTGGLSIALDRWRGHRDR